MTLEYLMAKASAPMFFSNITSLKFLHRGKVRDIYVVDEDNLLIVQTDRLSAFDVILPTPIPGKGHVLTALSRFWFEKLKEVVPNHLTGIPPESVVSKAEKDQVRDRAFVVRRLKPFPIEAVVRGYLAGSGWKEYKSSQEVCGIHLPPGFREAEKLPSPIFPPATKAPTGQHDENITFQQMVEIVGTDYAKQVRDAALTCYEIAASHAIKHSMIIADTKFEFGLDENKTLYLIDEALTPDSSRFWPLDQYRVGESPPSYDKQYVRDYLETLDWNKRAPGPALPQEIISKTSEKYNDALRLLAQGK